ncbi:SipW-dependent-type signal peptide-containing protein [Lactonifactor longoviformis]|uniref:SipW-dependent-type signal peptide-containing protein n=1 Tax=Lactonifactor longoviformis TaxID=341220 RepID=UPI001D015876|nr:SipW-dependent-type signal peptide-containing protein [Lactonifactor longoviformis]MCB5711479.1 SipW-dependent-type signal peptide-containing protein [Lactonifactor longoviformis]MCB5715446.1 SipW-dependent-type signal peptide-containing protein [Lactonifactor longoviformis]
MMNRKKLTAVVASVALVAVLGIGGTLMYFTDRDTKENVITLGKVDGTLTEEGNGTETETGLKYDNVMPGDVLEKKPVVTVAHDSQDAYLRIKLDINGMYRDEEDLPQSVIDVIEAALDIDKTVWEKGADNYYYYTGTTQGVVTADQAITFFTKVEIPAENWTNDMAKASFNINLQAELIQAANFADKLGYTDDTKTKINNWNIDAASIEAYNE